MNFFEAQEQAKRRTALLVGLFIAAVVAIIVSVYVVLMVFGVATAGAEAGIGFDLEIFALVALGTGVLIGGGSFFRTAQLRKGGPAVANMLGGRQVDPATTDPDERRLVNVVEEMAVASGMPVPAIFVMDQESSINAFAAGYGIHDAAVAVTRGTLETLDRDELQGVIAHEFSHILNGDMRLNVRLIGLLFGILLLTVVGRGVLRGSLYGRGGRSSRSGGKQGGGVAAAVALGVALVVVGYIGVFFGKLIKAAVSRQREYLADAAAVQYTRNPQGIAGALRKIGAHSSGAKIGNHHAEELSHLFFANGVGSALSRATSTHPPLPDRIRRIDPSWDGSFEIEPPKRDRRAARAAAAEDAQEAETSGERGHGFPMGRDGVTGLAAAAILMGSVGQPMPEHVAYARRILERIPDEFRHAVHDRAGAQATVLVLLGGDDERSRETRRRVAGEGVRERIEELEPLVGGLDPEARLPLIDMALPVLGEIEPLEAEAFRSRAEEVIRADGRIRYFDFALMHIMWKHLAGDRSRARGSRSGEAAGSLKAARRDLRVLLSALAWAGADDEAGAVNAFRVGMTALDGEAGELELGAPGTAGLSEVDEALGRLERGPLEVRRKVLEASATVILADGEVRTEEVELLRAVAESLELPLPPLMVTASGHG